MQPRPVLSTSLALLTRAAVMVCGACVSLSTLAADHPHESTAPRWAVDPNAVGDPLPSIGRSLFDYLVTEEKNGKREYNVPFPYAALIRHIEQRLRGGEGAPQVKQVLIPLGRSLQRNAAAPEFFKFPRVVAAIDTEAGPRGDQGMLLKDRVYIGFGEKSAVLEVISYNEAAARFEFQVVNDYRPGGTPRVAYADRAVCMSCHQNAAPIFARQNWDETSANPEIARLLRKEGDTFHGVTTERGVDVPFAIDAATDRANLFAVTQLLWRDGCGDGNEGDRCRAAAFSLALQYRLSGERAFDARSRRVQQEFFDVFVGRWKFRWPGGLLIPDADIPNRDPLQDVVSDASQMPPLNDALDQKGKKLLRDLLDNTNIQAPFEPLNARAPLETWYATDAISTARFVRGLAEFIAVGDARRIDAHLANDKAHAITAVRSVKSDCTVTTRALDNREMRIAFVCDKAARGTGSLTVSGRVYTRDGKITDGTVESLDVDGTPLNALDLGAESKLDRGVGGWTLTLYPRQSHMRARSGTGAAVENLMLTGRRALSSDATLSATAQATLKDEYSAVWKAIDALLDGNPAFSQKPFRRAVVMPALLTQLGASPGEWCCLDTTGMPPIVDDRMAPTQSTKR